MISYRIALQLLILSVSVWWSIDCLVVADSEGRLAELEKSNKRLSDLVDQLGTAFEKLTEETKLNSQRLDVMNQVSDDLRDHHVEKRQAAEEGSPQTCVPINELSLFLHGRDGRDGLPGVAGRDGVAGAPGSPGPQGARGERGPPGLSANHRPDAVVCPAGSRRNPYSNTCIRLVKISKTWSSAKQHCESSGEALATLRTLESSAWLRLQQQVGVDWGHSAWLGGVRAGDRWYWNGLVDGEIEYSFFQPSEPGVNDGCLGTWQPFEFNWDGYPCSGSRYFLCEKE